MTFDQAMDAIKAGKAVRHPEMSPGWKLVWRSQYDSHFFINPVTSHELAFAFSDKDKARTDWEVV